MHRLTALACLIALQAAAEDHLPQIAGIPVLTVCQSLRDPARYSGQTVIVVGRSTATSEGSWLDEECGLKVNSNGRQYPPVISTAYSPGEFAPPPQKTKGFKWDKQLLNRALTEVQRTTKLQPGANWYAVFGRLEAEPSRTIHRGQGLTATIYGYGHLNYAPAQLVFPDHAFHRLKAK